MRKQTHKYLVIYAPTQKGTEFDDRDDMLEHISALTPDDEEEQAIGTTTDILIRATRIQSVTIDEDEED